MSTSNHPTWLSAHFSTVDDPRTGNRTTHNLLDIIGLTIIGVLCGADDFTAIEAFGKTRLEWLRQFLPLQDGIPSHDTLGRCFGIMDPQQVEQGFASWVTSLAQLTGGQVIAIDGKRLRGSHNAATNKYAIHMVSAWAVENGLCLGQRKVDAKSNEITAIPELLAALDIKGSIITIDAMGTQKDIAAQIIDSEADYVLALKANHPELYSEVVQSFAHLAGSTAFPMAEEWEAAHGRIESRRCCVLDVKAKEFDWILAKDIQPWPGLSSIIMVEARRWTTDEPTVERRYYLSSLRLGDKSTLELGRIIRAHWAIENNLHWCLDVVFNEDRSRIRQGKADHNLAIIRRLVLNLLKMDKTNKLSLKNKRLRAGWDEKYLFQLLATVYS